jgi:hypothetical protein
MQSADLHPQALLSAYEHSESITDSEAIKSTWGTLFTQRERIMIMLKAP